MVTAVTEYVSGEEKLAWNYRAPAILDLIPDRTNYLAGQIATVLLKAPFSGTAVVSLERDRVTRSFVTNLVGNAPAIQVPLTDADAPATYLSVFLLRGQADSPRQVPEPEYSLGYCALNVDRPETRLNVALTLPAADFRPGETVTVDATVADGTGQPAPAAEVTLYAVDEGGLSLTGYEAPDPHGFFYAVRPLAVWANCTLPALLPDDPDAPMFQNKGYVIGGGGSVGEALRRNFLACAFWSAPLRTDAAGDTKRLRLARSRGDHRRGGVHFSGEQPRAIAARSPRCAELHAHDPPARAGKPAVARNRRRSSRARLQHPRRRIRRSRGAPAGLPLRRRRTNGVQSAALARAS